MALGRWKDVEKHVERGIAALEWAIVLPVVILFVAGILVLGTRYSDNMFVAQVSHEMALVVARVPGLDRAGNFTEPIVIGAVAADTDTASGCIDCLINGETSQCPITGEPGGVTVERQCATSIVTWYAEQFFATKGTFFEPGIAVNVSMSGVGTPVPMISVSISATPKQWLLPSFLQLPGGTVTMSSTLPYMVLP